MFRTLTCGMLAAAALSFTSSASAQTSLEHRWSVDFGMGWDRSISGNINSSAIGTLNGQSVVILRNKYEDVYGTGLHLRFGGGYLLSENSELRLTFTFQSLDADLTRMGDLGVSNLYAQYGDYQNLSMDFGYRQYVPIKGSIRGYGEGTIGVGFIDRTDIVLAAPSINYVSPATNFYDSTAVVTLSGNIGAAFGLTPAVDAFAQVGIRYVSGMSQVDQLAGTGLGTINDHSSRWAMPFTMGIRYRF